MKNKKGFTLAEILIALAVVGIAAAITVPVLMQNVNDNQYKSAWRNEWAILNQAALSLMMDNGGSFVNGMGTDSNTMRDKFLTKLSFAKVCNNTAANAGNCWAPTTYNYDGTTPVSAETRASAVLSNGSFAIFDWASATCADGSITNWGTANCGSIYADINGNALPNKYGRDIFIVHVLSDGLKAYGSTNATGAIDATNNNGCPGATSLGYGCSMTYLSAS